ncbi:MAG: S8/S53 family peptidase, partial [Deltaproteobacteria bacterium]|nr:S8/S53 family peptidase [Deltaproteobacteria bacterium]
MLASRRSLLPMCLSVCLRLSLGCAAPADSSLIEPSPQSAGELTRATAAFSVSVDPSLDPREQLTAADGSVRPIAACVDASGVRTEFIAGEAIVHAGNATEQAALTSFLSRHAAVITQTDQVPAPPRSLGRRLEAVQLAPTNFLVRVDTSTQSLASYVADATHRGLSGAHRCSSLAAVQTLAMISREIVGNGLRIAPDFLMRPGTMLHKTAETFIVDHNVNAFDLTTFKSQQPAATGNGSTISRAWQYVAGHGIPRQIRVAIVDSGFWLDASGHPFDNPIGTRTDLPTSPTQWDFTDNDAFAGGPAAVKCNGQTTCNWHGNGVADVAAGKLNDLQGYGGAGGTVADPWIFRIDYTQLEETAAIKTARLWGADVINMSFGAACDDDCMSYDNGIGLIGEIANARAAGLILVGIAGNYSMSVDTSHLTPCVLDGVICVGALNDDANTAASYSDYGAAVDIWAPANAWVMSDPENLPIGSYVGGTSIAAPVVSGVAAMMKAMDPTLSSDAVRDLLVQSRVLPGSNDPLVTAYLDARRAVTLASQSKIPVDALEPNNTPAQATTLNNGTTGELTIDHPGDADWFRFTLSDYSSVELDVENMVDLGGLFVTVSPESAPGAPSNVSFTGTPTGSIYKAGLAAPGTYLVYVGSQNPQPYILTLKTTIVGLQPDQFEADNTFATAATTAIGGLDVNLHVAGDVDYYAYKVSGQIYDPFSKYGFGIDSADMPLWVDVYVAGALVQSYGPVTTLELDLPSGDVVVRVSGGQPGRYSFHAGPYDDGGWSVYQYTPVPWYLDPGGPYEGVLPGVDQVLAIPAGMSGDLVVTGQVHVQVLDLRGAVLAQGVTSSRGETVSLAPLGGSEG